MQQTVAILGLGYVGLPLARVLSKKKNYRIVGIDIDTSRIRTLRNKYRRSLIEFTTDFKKLRDADISIVCVPTPVLKNYKPDYQPLKNACVQIAQYLHKNQLVIIESTINPGTCEEIVLPILRRSGLKVEKDFYLAHCPERIDPGSAKWHLLNIPRVVGGIGKKSLARAARFYRSFVKAAVKPMKTLKAAEATKIVENSFRDINIAYVNELAKSFDELGIDIIDVLEGAGTKPFAFMPHYPGCGVGGHCIPVDPYYLIERAKQNGFDHEFLQMARMVNHGMPAYTVSLLEKQLKKLRLPKNKVTVGLLGLAYKPHINDVRESPAVEIFNILKRKKFRVVVCDPYVKRWPAVGCALMRTLRQTLRQSNVLILATAHKEFLKLTPEALKKYAILGVIDGRNVLSKKLFEQTEILYKGIGR